MVKRAVKKKGSGEWGAASRRRRYTFVATSYIMVVGTVQFIKEICMLENLMLEEYYYYMAHQEEIIKGHLDEYVSIKGTKIQGYYKTCLDGFDAAVKQFPNAKG
jgi:hypothetical protein